MQLTWASGLLLPPTAFWRQPPSLVPVGQERGLRFSGCPEALHSRVSDGPPTLETGPFSGARDPFSRRVFLISKVQLTRVWSVPLTSSPGSCFFLGVGIGAAAARGSGEVARDPVASLRPALAHSPMSLALLLSSWLHPGVEQELRAVRLLRALRDHSPTGTRDAPSRSLSSLLCLEQSFCKKAFLGIQLHSPLEPSAWTSSSFLRNHWIFLKASSGERERMVPREGAKLWVTTVLPPS